MILLSFYLPVCVAAATPPQPSLRIPTGTPRGEHRGAEPVQTYSGDFSEAIKQFLSDSGILQFSLEEQTVPGRNHLKTGLIQADGSGDKSFQIFAMQRRKSDYPRGAPVFSCDLLGLTLPLSDKLLQAEEVLKITGVVPLVARISQKDEPCYVELYPYICAQDGASWIGHFLDTPGANVSLLSDVMRKMGAQTGKMFDAGPHADCHPGNFLVTKNNSVLAIDFRGFLRASTKGTPTPPALLFLQILSQTIRRYFKGKITKPRNEKQIKQFEEDYQKFFVLCREAFIKGMEEELEGNCLYGQLDIMPSAKEIISITKRLTEVSFQYHSNNHDSDSD